MEEHVLNNDSKKQQKINVDKYPDIQNEGETYNVADTKTNIKNNQSNNKDYIASIVIEILLLTLFGFGIFITLVNGQYLQTAFILLGCVVVSYLLAKIIIRIMKHKGFYSKEKKD